MSNRRQKVDEIFEPEEQKLYVTKFRLEVIGSKINAIKEEISSLSYDVKQNIVRTLVQTRDEGIETRSGEIILPGKVKSTISEAQNCKVGVNFHRELDNQIFQDVVLVDNGWIKVLHQWGRYEPQDINRSTWMPSNMNSVEVFHRLHGIYNNVLEDAVELVGHRLTGLDYFKDFTYAAMDNLDKYSWKDWVVITNDYMCERSVDRKGKYSVDDVVNDDVVGKVINLVRTESEY